MSGSVANRIGPVVAFAAIEVFRVNEPGSSGFVVARLLVGGAALNSGLPTNNPKISISAPSLWAV